MKQIDQLTEKQIIECLTPDIGQTFDLPKKSKQPQAKKYKKASVLIPFVREKNQWHIVFIRRAESEKDRHSGQVAFVGGKAEDFDISEIDTALRETQEEIGVNPNDVTILGQLGFHYSVSSFQITPVVATIPWPYQLSLDLAEVSRVFTIPLTWLADKDNYQIKYHQPPESDHTIPVVYFKKYEGELLWGATARMMVSLLEQFK